MSDVLQWAAVFLLPLGLGLVFFVIGGLVLALGVAAVVLAPELWLLGRELDLSKEVPPR